TTAAGPAGPGATLHTFLDGMGELTTTLARKLSASVRTASPVKAVAYKDGKFTVQVNGTVLNADAVILASPSFATADMIAEMAGDTANAIRDIWHAPVDVVCHGHRIEDVEHPLNGFGVLVPRSEGIRSLGCLWCNSIFPGQAPDGQHLLRTIIGGAHDPDVVNLSNEEIEHIAQMDNGRLFGANAQPIFRKIFRHKRGIAQYTRGHLERVAVTEKLENDIPGLYFTGASYRGVSVNGCAKDAFRVARLFWEKWESTP
ncbi:protoporphyrinogen oxidase, partial [bacterium]|nr:protoporphyrinogen oxidase [bacterium]